MHRPGVRPTIMVTRTGSGAKSHVIPVHGRRQRLLVQLNTLVSRRRGRDGRPIGSRSVAGTIIAAKTRSKSILLYGVQPVGSDNFFTCLNSVFGIAQEAGKTQAFWLDLPGRSARVW